MPIADPNNVLFKIAHPDLYERNPFNILNLPVDATAKDIRRRKEDIEAAFDAGTEADEFRGILPGDDNRKTPSRAEIEELFSTLEDPEKRIAYSLFWFWPMEKADTEERRHRSNPNGEFGHRAVIVQWETEARLPVESTTTGIVARHNLAVFHHMMGLAYERSLKQYDTGTASTPPEVDGHWKSAIYWWNDVSSQSEFWHSISERISALGDPRIDFRFARALKEQFAFAFDQVNVELAIDFAKCGRDVDAKRQTEYMKLSQPDSDDVEGTFDDAFSGLLRQTEAIVKTAREESQKNPKVGLTKANEILSRTREQLRISRIVLQRGTLVRNAICTTVFGGVRTCLIDYGNSTKDWDRCLNLTKELKQLAETDDQCRIVDEDERIIKNNLKQQSESTSCCLCHQSVQDARNTATNNQLILGIKAKYKDAISFHMYGEVEKGSELGKVRFKTRSISIPMCWTCACPILLELGRICARKKLFDEQKQQNRVVVMSMTAMPIVPECGYESMTDEIESMLCAEINRLDDARDTMSISKNDSSRALQAILRHSEVSSLLSCGWKFGKTVSQAEIRSIWGMPEPASLKASSLMSPEERAKIPIPILDEPYLYRPKQGCCIPFILLIIGGLAIIERIYQSLIS